MASNFYEKYFHSKVLELKSYFSYQKYFFAAYHNYYFPVKVENLTEDIYEFLWNKNFHLIQPSLWIKIVKSCLYIYMLFLFLFRLLIFLFYLSFPPFLFLFLLTFIYFFFISCSSSSSSSSLLFLLHFFSCHVFCLSMSVFLSLLSFRSFYLCLSIYVVLSHDQTNLYCLSFILAVNWL